MKIHRFRLLILLLLVALALPLSGCGLLVSAVATDFNLSIEPAEIAIAQGEEAQVTLIVSRILPIDVTPFPLTATLYNPPQGVTLAEGQVELPSGIDERVLTIAVDDTAEVGGPYTVTVEATSGVKTKQATFELTVTPGS